MRVKFILMGSPFLFNFCTSIVLTPHLFPTIISVKILSPIIAILLFFSSKVLITLRVFLFVGLRALHLKFKPSSLPILEILSIEGLLLTMYDTRLRLSNQVVEEVKTHFQDLVFKTIIHRNVTLGESPSYGETIMIHDASSKGAINYLNLATEILEKEHNKNEENIVTNE